MFAIIGVIFFAIATLMHLFGWSSGKVNVLLFELLGLLCVALHLAFGGYTAGWFSRRPARPAPPPAA
jgi:hypothetical protein